MSIKDQEEFISLLHSIKVCAANNFFEKSKEYEDKLISYIDNYIEENTDNYSIYLAFINKKGLLGEFIEFCNNIGLARIEFEKNK